MAGAQSPLKKKLWAFSQRFDQWSRSASHHGTACHRRNRHRPRLTLSQGWCRSPFSLAPASTCGIAPHAVTQFEQSSVGRTAALA